MAPWLVIFAVLATQTPGNPAACRPLWETDLVRQYDFNNFGKSSHLKRAPAVWETQEGTVFISPDLLAVYQASSEPDTPLRSRDQTGGAGRFALQLRFLRVRDGKEVKALHLPTDSEYSSVLPTHDGKFLIRTGDIVRLYSPGFEEVASKNLPLSHVFQHESWRLQVSPSGRNVYLEHAEMSRSESKSEGSLLDADTLRTTATFDTRGKSLKIAGDSLLLGIKDYGTVVGEFKISAGWRPLFQVDLPGDASCGFGTTFLRTNDPILATFGCNTLRLLSLEGKQLSTASVDKHEEFVSAVGAGSLVAAEVHYHRSDPFDLGISSKPVRIAVYDSTTKSEKCYIPITEPVSTWSSLYGVSSVGGVAVIQGGVLRFYQP